jgi:hypothetical protein
VKLSTGGALGRRPARRLQVEGNPARVRDGGPAVSAPGLPAFRLLPDSLSPERFRTLVFSAALFLEALFLEALFSDVLFSDVLFSDVLFSDVLFPDVLFPDVWFSDVLFPDVWFPDRAARRIRADQRRSRAPLYSENGIVVRDQLTVRSMWS